MRRKQSVLSFVMILVLLLSSFTIQAKHVENKNRFNDVNDEHWASEYIERMNELGIIDGYKDGRFLPNEKVTREQFSKMMVLTLQLKLIKPSEPYFADVSKNDWSYSYIETARTYLTGFRGTPKDYFRPLSNAVREDMAVAIVKGLGLSVEDVDLNVLNRYKDSNQISEKLKPYVAKAIKEGIMVGNDLVFNPQGLLTRAEAATLLYRLVTDEKVVYEDDKIVYDDKVVVPVKNEGKRTPVLTADREDKGIELEWTETEADQFTYYKIVFSKTDKTPVYPENGYLAYLTDVDDSEYFVKAGQTYQGGDFGGKLKSGEIYYVSITAVYGNGDKYYPSNTVAIKLP